METNRRGFFGLLGAAVGALTLPRTQPAPVIPALETEPVAASLKPVAEPVALPLVTAERTDYWKHCADTFEKHDLRYNLLEIVSYNHREEFEGPIEMLGFGGQYDGPVYIKERNYDHQTRRVTVKATRYPKVHMTTPS